MGASGFNRLVVASISGRLRDQTLSSSVCGERASSCGLLIFTVHIIHEYE